MVLPTIVIRGTKKIEENIVIGNHFIVNIAHGVEGFMPENAYYQE